MTAPLDWIELVMGMDCNCRCQTCPSGLHGGGGAMDTKEVAAWLRRGRRRGASGVWFGGGEPTLHPGLVAAVKRARQLGYQRVRVQTNALRLAYEAYAERLVGAGADEFSVPLLGADAAAYDAFTRREGSFDLLVQGMENLLGHGTRVEGDVLITAASAGRLTEMVERFAGLGVARFNFWLVSLHGLDAEQQAHHLPTMQALVPHLQQAMDRAEELGAPATTLHTPPCVLDAAHHHRYVHAGTWRLLVVTPGGEPFMAQDSPMEGGVYLRTCEACSWRGRCLGLRADYLAAHGDSGFEPLA